MPRVRSLGNCSQAAWLRRSPLTSTGQTRKPPQEEQRAHLVHAFESVTSSAWCRELACMPYRTASVTKSYTV
eukprot:6182184-Pleurochrysis_carterae.AAC.2